MRLQRDISLFSGSISIIALVLSYIFWFRNSDYFYNLCMGLFSSGILVCAVATVTYFNERNKAVLSLYRGCFRFMKQLNLNLRPNNQIELETVRENFARIEESYNIDIYYFVNELSILCKHSTLRRIVMDIWESARNIYLIVMNDNNKIMQFYVGDISLDDIANYRFQYVGPESVSYIKKLQKSLDELRVHMNYYNARKEKQNAGGENNAD